MDMTSIQNDTDDDDDNDNPKRYYTRTIVLCHNVLKSKRKKLIVLGCILLIVMIRSYTYSFESSVVESRVNVGVVDQKTTTTTTIKNDNNINISRQDVIRTWDYVEKNLLDEKSPSYPWCNLTKQSYDENSKKYQQQQLVYIKIDKAASSTLAGINIRLARKVGAKVAAAQRQQQQQQDDDDSNNLVCSHTYRHGRASDQIEQTPQNAIRWTFLRDPAVRALSEYYHFWVSRRGYGVKYGLVQPLLQKRKNFQLEYIMFHPNPQTVVQESIASNE